MTCGYMRSQGPTVLWEGNIKVCIHNYLRRFHAGIKLKTKLIHKKVLAFKKLG